MRVDKDKRKVMVYGVGGWIQNAFLFIREHAEEHGGRELVLDILNSRATFITLEAFQTGEILFLNKAGIIYVELPVRDLLIETMASKEIAVEVSLVGGNIFFGSFFVEMPPERSRLSDYLNFTPHFLYLCREEGDLILNKDYLFSVKHHTPIPLTT